MGTSKASQIGANPALAKRAKPSTDVPDQGQAPSSETTTTDHRSPSVRTRKVRRTVDLSPNAHRDLGRWCDDLADSLGLSRVTSQDVLTALVGELLEADAEAPLSAAVRRRIERART